MSRRRKDSVGRPCPYCKRRMLAHKDVRDERSHGLVATVEHIKTQASGGTHEAINIMIACQRCNNLRGQLDYDLFLDFARTIIQKFPNTPTVILREYLNAYVRELAAIGFHSVKKRRAVMSAVLLDISERIKNY